MLNKKFEWIIEVVTKRTLIPENAKDVRKREEKFEKENERE